jgi:hypothetical protein
VISIRKLGRRVGAEIAGVDLSRPLDDGAFARISDAFFEHHVRKEHRLEGNAEILVVSTVAPGEGRWAWARRGRIADTRWPSR